ncbi:MAG TPA: putative Ig domain-containing protein, partial [Candidatus Dormibacteraeota bacterium]|nr:putative Ig domain-containing protein [Candidatus Dormibacteraeota bacterium]
MFGTACTSTLGQTPTQVPNVSPLTSPSTQTSPSSAPPTPATISGFPLGAGEVALAYSGALSANGGTAPYNWSIIAGALPGGLNLGQDGSVTGTPTTPGTYTFSIQVTDKNNASSNASGTIKVYPRLVASLIPACASACSVEQGCVNVCGNFGTQSGG